MRLFGLHKLTVETAGQSGAGALISLVGIVDAPRFRARVLEQKERLTQPLHPTIPSAQPDNTLLQIVVEMAASLKRIETLLSQKLNR